MAFITSIDISDAPAVWGDLGFAVDEDAALVDGVSLRLGRHPGDGLLSWSLWGVALPPGPTQVDGLPTIVVDDDPPPPTSARHPNGVVGLDHVVVATPDHPRSIAAFEKIGLSVRRIRETGSMLQAFFRLGPVILELVGPATATGDDPARFFGLAWTCAELDETVAGLGGRLRPPKEAVQPGRRIATLDRAAGSQVSMAFMSAAAPPAGDPD